MSGRIKTTDFDAIATSAPLDRQASIVRDGSGDHYVAPMPDHQAHWSAPPLPLAPRPADVEDLTGRTLGQLTVIRYHGRIGSGSRWLVRCSCGDYELRKTRVIVRQHSAGSGGRCRVCDRVAQMREGSAYFKAGQETLDGFVNRLREPKS
ncbi:MAG: hypothetical protein KA105_02695 [Caulobacter sp.]|nr:hypothetical protein [Caulobacter sp.]